MSVEQLPDRLNLSSFLGDDFSLLVEFSDKAGNDYAVDAGDITATIDRDTPVSLAVTQFGPAAVLLEATAAELGDTARTDRWTLKGPDRAWFSGSFTVSEDTIFGSHGSGDVLSVTVGATRVSAVVSPGVPGPQGEKGDTGPQGPKGEKGDTGPAGADGTASLVIQEDGVTVITGATTINFVGATVTDDGAGTITVTITGGGGGTTVTFYEDPNDPGLYTFTGLTEDPNDPGLYLLAGVVEDPSSPGLYLMSTPPAGLLEDADDPGLYYVTSEAGLIEDSSNPGLYHLTPEADLTEDPSDAGLYLIGT